MESPRNELLYLELHYVFRYVLNVKFHDVEPNSNPCHKMVIFIICVAIETLT